MPVSARIRDTEPFEHADPEHLTRPLQIRLLSRDPFLVHITFPPGCIAQRHSHTYDTVYVVQRGVLAVNRVPYREGDVFWVHAGEEYGPESAGPEGAEIFVHSVGGPLGTDWV